MLASTLQFICMMSKKIKTQWFEVDLSSTTYRTFQVKAESPAKAQEIALSEMYADWEISQSWKDNAEVVSCDPFSYDEDGNKVIGTSHMSDDEFGAYIRGE